MVYHHVITYIFGGMINANLLRLILIFVFSDGKNKRIIFFIIKTFGGINITHIIYYFDTINL